MISKPHRWRAPSLFWTFAGAFLAVLLAATILQAVVVAAVVQPMLAHWAAARAELLGRETARAIAAAGPQAPPATIEAILRARTNAPEPLLLVFRDAGGRLIGGHHLPPPVRRRLGELLESTAGTGAEIVLRGHRRASGGPLHAPPPEGPPPGRWRGRFRLLGRHPVRAGGRQLGEVATLMPVRHFPLAAAAVPRSRWLFLPLAILVSGAAGLLLFRVLVRRLQALERLAARVAAGDLSARVPDPGRDELGRLGSGLNHMAERLAEARQLLEAGDRQRRRLLADISHELATPLTSIRGYAETLLDAGVPLTAEERETYVRHVHEEALRMDLLIQDLLELTRLEAGGARLERERLDWTALCRNTVERYAPRFQQAGLRLEWSGAAPEAWIVADGRRLEQVVENLLVNALRYVPAGGRVTLELQPLTGATPARYRLVVADDGPGFPAADLPHVFDRFYRADGARSGGGGSGLGLAIVQEIVRRHGGRVRASNRPRGGAALEVELPAAGATADADASSSSGSA